MRRIVIPTDFSKNATHALEQACLFFKLSYCEFYLVHTYSEEVFEESLFYAPSEAPVLKSDIKATVNQKLIDLLEYIQEKNHNPLHRFKIRAIDHSLLDGIDNLIQQEEIDLVVMGTKGSKNNPEVVFGSYTLNMIKYVDCPVLVIPEKYEFKRPQNFLLATNFEVPKRKDLKLLEIMAKDFKAKFHFLHQTKEPQLSPKEKEIKEFICAVLKDCDLEFHLLDGDNLIQTIYRFMNKTPVDLIIMTNTYTHYFEKKMDKRAIDYMTLGTEVPLLICQNTDN